MPVSRFNLARVHVIDESNARKAAFNFYMENISKVEISYRGNLARIFFKRPFMTRFLTDKSRKNLLVNIKNSTYQAKIEEFFRRIQSYKREMIYQQRLERYPFIARLASHWPIYETLTFYLTIIINIVLLAMIRETNYNLSIQHDEILAGILYILTGFQIIFAGFGFVSYVLEYSPIIYRTPKSIENEAYNRALNRIEGTILQREIRKASESINNKTVVQSVFQVLLHPHILYSFLYFVVSFLAIQNFMWYGLLLFDSIKRSDVLKNVLRSITLNYKQLLLALILAIIVSYLFSIFGFLFFSDYYDPKNGLYCTTLFNCFISTLNKGTRAQGGIGTALGQPADSQYAYRIIFDMGYFIIIIIILLKIIFGIIIDTFAELRDIKKEQIKNLEETCFICGKNK